MLFIRVNLRPLPCLHAISLIISDSIHGRSYIWSYGPVRTPVKVYRVITNFGTWEVLEDRVGCSCCNSAMDEYHLDSVRGAALSSPLELFVFLCQSTLRSSTRTQLFEVSDICVLVRLKTYLQEARSE